MVMSPHSVRLFMCFEMAGRLISNFSATEFKCNDRWAIILMISLRVGSAMAWKTSLLILLLLCNQSVTQIYMEPFGYANFFLFGSNQKKVPKTPKLDSFL